MERDSDPDPLDFYVDDVETIDQDDLLKSSVSRRHDSTGRKYTVFSRQHRCFRFITVEPAVVVSTFLMTLYSILSKEYFYQRIASDYNLTRNNTEEPSCRGINQSDPDYELHQMVSAETAALSLYLSISSE